MTDIAKLKTRFEVKGARDRQDFGAGTEGIALTSITNRVWPCAGFSHLT